MMNLVGAQNLLLVGLANWKFKFDKLRLSNGKTSYGKESACNAGALGSIPGSGRSPGEGNGNPLHCSCLGNPMNRGTWWATVHGIAKNWT